MVISKLSNGRMRLKLCAVVFFSLAACEKNNMSERPHSIEEIELTTSYSATLDPDGALSVPLSGCTNIGCSGSLSDGAGNVTRYKIGIDPDGLDQFIAISGIQLSPLRAEDTPTQGQATYQGRYDVLFIEDIAAKQTSTNVYQLIGLQGSQTGTISLNADFGNGTLIGHDQDLSINAAIDGATLLGNATFKSTQGTLAGQITSEQTLGSFQGHDAQTVFSGGFIAYP